MQKQSNALIDYLLKRFTLGTDAELARMMELQPPTISKMRHGKMSLTPSFILKVHDTFDIPVKEIKQIADVR
jgi:plasmid maintenance system antidote protein VapI